MLFDELCIVRIQVIGCAVGCLEVFGLYKKLNMLFKALLIVALLAIGVAVNSFIQQQLKNTDRHVSENLFYTIKSNLKLDHFVICDNAKKIDPSSFSGRWVLYFVNSSSNTIPFVQINRMAKMFNLVNRDFLFSSPKLVVLSTRENHQEEKMNGFINKRHMQSSIMVATVNKNIMSRFEKIESGVLADKKGGLYLLVSPHGNLRAILPENISDFNLVKEFIVLRSRHIVLR